jgi:nucleoside-diphosphate-sugar epimerase
MNADVLITGATGLIGGEVAWRLMRAGRRVWCVVRCPSFADAAARLEHRFAVSGVGCDWSKVVALPGDISVPKLGFDKNTLAHLRTNCGVVVHCAADTSFAADNRCEAINVDGTWNVLETCRAIGPQVRLFHMSSAVVCTERRGGLAERRHSGRSQTEEALSSNPKSEIRNLTLGEPPHLGSYKANLVREDMPYAGYVNDYILSKRRCEELVLRSPLNTVVLRPSLVLSQGVNSREFARSVLWVFPVIRSLGVLPLTGDEPIDVVSVRFVADGVVRMLERSLPHRIYHLSAGPESSLSWKAIFAALSQQGHDYSGVRFRPDLDWDSFGRSAPRLRRLKELINYYLPFMRAGAVYDSARLKQALLDDFPLCPKPTNYCAELLGQFTEREAFAEAFAP